MSYIAPKKRVSRRTLLRDTAAAGFLFGLGILKKRPLFAGGGKSSGEQGISGASPPGREAMFYTLLSHRRVKCGLCFRRCILHDGERGECRNRENHRITRAGVGPFDMRRRLARVTVQAGDDERRFFDGTRVRCDLLFTYGGGHSEVHRRDGPDSGHVENARYTPGPAAPSRIPFT